MLTESKTCHPRSVHSGLAIVTRRAVLFCAGTPVLDKFPPKFLAAASKFRPRRLRKNPYLQNKTRALYGRVGLARAER